MNKDQARRVPRSFVFSIFGYLILVPAFARGISRQIGTLGMNLDSVGDSKNNMSEWANKIFFEIVSESNPYLLVAIDPVGTILFANSSAENLFNYSQGELTEKSIESIIPNGFRNIEVQFGDKMSLQPRFLVADSGCEFFGRRKDGIEFRVEIFICPKFTERGPIVLATIIALEKTNYYQRALDEIKSREDLISIVSHELRTPLTSLGMQLQLLGRIAKRDFQNCQSSASIFELAAQSEREVIRFLRLINSLLDTSRIRAGRLKLNKEEMNLGELTREVIAHSQFDIENSRCVIQENIDESVLGFWDVGRIEQVVSNLLSNALKYGAGKPIEIYVCKAPLRATLIVRDHGIGVCKEDQARLFNQFERLETSKRFTGFGLGLFIVRQIVEAHGGSIRIESEPGKFTTFTVELPLKVTA